MLRHQRLRWLALPFLVGLPTAVAQAPTLAGTWSATPLSSQWVIGDWGPACGPKPSGGGAPGGTVTVRQNGNELAFLGAGRTYSTTECWEQFPGLNRLSHSASARNFRNVCKTGPGNPRQATVTTTITATDDRITFDETGQYQFVVEGQNCTASVRRSRFLSLIRREGEPEPSTAPIPAAKPTATTAAPAATASAVATPAEVKAAEEAEPRQNQCLNPGEPARLEVRPSRKLLRPGETFAFRASVLDKAGCALNVAPTFRLAGSPLGVELVTAGTVRVSEGAPEGEVKVLASVRERSVSVVAEVVSRARYDALLGEGRFDALGESGEAAVTRIESGSIGARSTVLRDEGAFRKKLFIGVVGSAALLLGLAGFIIIRRSRREQRRAAIPPSRGRVPSPPHGRPALVSPLRPEPSKSMVCPTCRDEYPPEARFCANDGNRLVPLQRGLGVAPAGGVCPICGQGYDPGVTTCPKHDEPLVPSAVYGTAQVPLVSARKICPTCGAQFTGESQFCGRCGASLVPVN